MKTCEREHYVVYVPARAKALAYQTPDRDWVSSPSHAETLGKNRVFHKKKSELYIDRILPQCLDILNLTKCVLVNFLSKLYPLLFHT